MENLKMNGFSELGISHDLIRILDGNHITEPTPIQRQAIPALLAHKDVLGQAQTGTGKTLAFILPMIEGIEKQNTHVQALIVAPTRELALQITGEAKKYGSAKGLGVLALYGGQDLAQQTRRLKGAIHMVIGTPGRLLDHLGRGSVNLDKLKMLVLDEADQMLDMGFINDIEMIMKKTPEDRQTMLFSATMPAEIQSLASRYMREPVKLRAPGAQTTLEGINQLIIETTDRKKSDVLLHLIDEQRPFMAIVFCRTKRRASALNELLQSKGFHSDALHGDISQARREKVMRAFREAKLQFLVATDVAARGLDVEGITHIFNYDIPRDAESYIHRIGRTGRAGKTGVAITLTTPRDRCYLDLIEKGIKTDLRKQKIIIKFNDHVPGVTARRTSPHHDSGKQLGNTRAAVRMAPKKTHGKPRSSSKGRRMMDSAASRSVGREAFDFTERGTIPKPNGRKSVAPMGRGTKNRPAVKPDLAFSKRESSLHSPYQKAGKKRKNKAPVL